MKNETKVINYEGGIPTIWGIDAENANLPRWVETCAFDHEEEAKLFIAMLRVRMRKEDEESREMKRFIEEYKVIMRLLNPDSTWAK